MFKFEYKGIRIEGTAEIERYDYKDANSVGRTRFDRNVFVRVHFWDFVIDNDLYELAMVKSSLNYFMQSYWKRSRKQGSKIELATSLEHQDNGSLQSLKLIAKQKNNVSSLEVTLAENSNRLGCVYLSAQEVLMLDIAVAKAITLLTPQTVYSG